jgi:hypothetical protein
LVLRTEFRAKISFSTPFCVHGKASLPTTTISLAPGLPDFPWSKNIPNGHKIYQYFAFKGPPKYTRIGIFGLKITHLATVMSSPNA